MARAEAPLSKLPWMAKQTRKTCTWRHAAKRSSFLSSRVSRRPSQTVGDRTLLQIWRPPTTLSIRYTAPSSDRLAVLAVDSINTYYNTVNKRIHIISAYFLAAASDKRMRLLTSLYGIYNVPSVIALWEHGQNTSFLIRTTTLESGAFAREQVSM